MSRGSPEWRASAEQDRDHHDVHVVHKPRSEEVADCCGRRGHQIVWRSTLNRRTATHALWWAVVGIVELSRKRLQLLISQDPFDQRGWPADVGREDVDVGGDEPSPVIRPPEA